MVVGGCARRGGVFVGSSSGRVATAVSDRGLGRVLLGAERGVTGNGWRKMVRYGLPVRW